MPKKKSKSGGGGKDSAFFKRYEGALDAGYPSDEAAAIAHSKASEGVDRSRVHAAGRKLRESMWPHLRRANRAK